MADDHGGRWDDDEHNDDPARTRSEQAARPRDRHRPPRPPGPGHPDRIRVAVAHQVEVPARHADLFLDVRGTGLAPGDRATARDRAVAKIAADLAAACPAAEEAAVSAVRGDEPGGRLKKGVASIYSLRVRQVPLEALGQALEVVERSKEAKLRAILWSYDDEDEARDAWAESALRRAAARAGRMAAALGVRLLGVHDARVRFLNADAAGSPDDDPFRHGVMVHPEYDLGKLVRLSLRPSKTVEVRVTVEYRVSGFEPA